jgi:putative glutamine amidotransferase
MPPGQRPLVGISTSEVRRREDVRPVPEGEPPMRELALGFSYPAAVERGLGLPVVLAPVDHGLVGELVSRLSGLVVSGGPDLHPRAYGEEPDPTLGPTEAELDEFELALVRAADAAGLPILGICRGAQVLNVARGGSLVQDVPTAFGTEVHHRQTAPGRERAHPVRVERGTRLAKILRVREHVVNSFHHQAVDRLGAALVPTAWAPDGVVEAIEDPARDFVVGVQWHAESLEGRRDDALFAAFTAAAARYAAQAAARRAAA